jgi:hypothetical protein
MAHDEENKRESNMEERDEQARREAPASSGDVEREHNDERIDEDDARY